MVWDDSGVRWFGVSWPVTFLISILTILITDFISNLTSSIFLILLYMYFYCTRTFLNCSI